jgi:hypothetical protein
MKSPYRIRNWPEYKASLRRQRGLTVWLSDEAISSWRALPSGKPSGQRICADIAIEAALAIRMVSHLPLRQTEGFLRSLADCLRWRSSFPITRLCHGSSGRSAYPPAHRQHMAAAGAEVVEEAVGAAAGFG